MMKMGQWICCLNDRIRAIRDGMFRAACIGMATESGRTEELVASMMWTPPVAKTALKAEATKQPQAITKISKTMTKSLAMCLPAGQPDQPGSPGLRLTCVRAERKLRA